MSKHLILTSAFNNLHANVEIINDYIEKSLPQLELLNNYHEAIFSSNWILLQMLPSFQEDIEREKKIIEELVYYDSLLKDAIIQINTNKYFPFFPDFTEIYNISQNLISRIKIGLEIGEDKIKLLQSFIKNIVECNITSFSTTYN